jgi:hypothetical protein
MKSKSLRKLSFALNQEDYIYSVRLPINTAFWYFNSTLLPRGNASDDLVFWWHSEVERLIDLQLPNWISIAPTNGQFDRAAAIEQAIDSIERDIDSNWIRMTERKAETLKVDVAKLLIPDRRQKSAELFSRVRAISAAALQTAPAKRMPARPMDVFVMWDHVSTALAFYFEIEIATVNGNFLHVVWWKDRVGTHLDGRLADFLDITRKRKGPDLTPAIQASVDLVPVQRIWDFAIAAIARQLAKPPNELLLPDRDAAEANFFAMVRQACRYGKKTNRP